MIALLLSHWFLAFAVGDVGRRVILSLRVVLEKFHRSHFDNLIWKKGLSVDSGGSFRSGSRRGSGLISRSTCLILCESWFGYGTRVTSEVGF